MLLEGMAGRIAQRIQGPIAATMTGLTSLRVAQSEGEGDESTRAGMRYIMSGAGATGIAPVQAIPTTAAQWFIWNPNGNPVAVFLDVLGMVLISGTAGAGATLYGCLVGPRYAPATIPTALTAGVTIVNSNPGSVRASGVIVASAQTLQNTIAANWFPIAQMTTAQTVLLQTQWEQRDIRGKYVIPPGCGFGLANISPTGSTPLFAPYGMWREYGIDLE